MLKNITQTSCKPLLAAKQLEIQQEQNDNEFYKQEYFPNFSIVVTVVSSFPAFIFLYKAI